MTECTQTQLRFEAHFSRQVVGRFDGSRLTADGGGLLLSQAGRNMGLLRRVAMAISGHKARAVFECYNIVSVRDLKDAAVKLEPYLSTQNGHRTETVVAEFALPS